MNHYDEEILEQFALNSQSYDWRTQEDLNRHLEECRLCHTIFDYFADFYKKLNKDIETISPVVNEFVSMLYPVIPISVYHVKEHQEPVGYMTILAAMSATQGSDRFRSVATLASEEQQAVVRILQDSATNRLRIYVITDDPRKRSHAVLSFPDISADFVTDNRGQLEVDFPPSNWKNLKGVLRLTAAEHLLTKKSLTGESNGNSAQYQGGLHSVSVSYRTNKLYIETTKRKQYAPDFNVAVVSAENNVTYFIPLRNGSGECVIPSLPDSLTLRLYC